MKIWILFFITIFGFDLNAQGINKNRIFQKLEAHSEKKWFQCRKDSDCSYLIGPCNVAIGFNSVYEKSILKFFENLPLSEKVCIDYVGEKLPTSSKCVKKKCQLEFK